VRARLRHVLWIGGGTGAGKSSIATLLAERHGLTRYNYDWHDSRDHTDRTRADRHPHRAAFLAMTLDERWVLRSPLQMVDETLGGFRERFEMVTEDLLLIPEHPRVIADGFGLLPELVHPLIESPRQAIFLLPTPEFRVVALERRGWGSADETSDVKRARANRLARDGLLTDHVRESAARLGLATVDVDGSRGLDDIVAEVTKHFGQCLAAVMTHEEDLDA
jgi:adenylate kinase family enzyme